jgi:energy-coupling factor transport system ATP-binding protein
MIKIRDLTFEYFERDEEGYLTDMVNAIRGINFDAARGEFVAIAGRNGSGKSTFAKLLNRLMAPMDGTVFIAGYDAADSKNALEIRKNVGMVFQNPDEQLIGSIVEEDVAFGAENIGVPYKELRSRVDDAIKMVGLDEVYETQGENDKDGNEKKRSIKQAAKRRINELSGGEKQKVSIAGVLAMKPRCIVLDEATSMLDPVSRRQILDILKNLNQEYGITIIMITHIMEELLLADTIYVFDKGRIVLKGSKERVFSDREVLKSFGLEFPDILELRDKLFKNGVIRSRDVYSLEDMISCIRLEHPYSFMKKKTVPALMAGKREVNPIYAIIFDKVSFLYGKKQVLDNVSLTISKGDYVAVMGDTGAGKSTLLQLIPGLLKPQKGNIYVDGIDIWDSATDRKKIRSKIGYLFQYPEQQLFAKNVYEDVIFGPRNIGLSEIEAESRTYEAIKLVGLPQSVYDLPMSRLSGGQKRRVALAGVLAMKPEYLILDEPTAGLDPEGRKELLDIIDALHIQVGMTIIMVTHDADSVAKRADRVIVMDKGTLVSAGSSVEAFVDMLEKKRVLRDEGNTRGVLNLESTALRDIGVYAGNGIDDAVDLPVSLKLIVALSRMGMDIPYYTVDMDECAEMIKTALV